MFRQNSIANTYFRTMQRSNGFAEAVGIELLRRIYHTVCHSIHHHSHNKINSRKMTLSWIEDIRLNAAAARIV